MKNPFQLRNSFKAVFGKCEYKFDSVTTTCPLYRENHQYVYYFSLVIILLFFYSSPQSFLHMSLFHILFSLFLYFWTVFYSIKSTTVLCTQIIIIIIIIIITIITIITTILPITFTSTGYDSYCNVLWFGRLLSSASDISPGLNCPLIGWTLSL